MRLPDRMPLYASADVFVVTSPRDGLNRMPLEFVAAHSTTHSGLVSGQSSRKSSAIDLPSKEKEEEEEEEKPDPGVLILSEFVSCTRVLLVRLFIPTHPPTHPPIQSSTHPPTHPPTSIGSNVR